MGFIKKWFRPFQPFFFYCRLCLYRLFKKTNFYILWNRGLGDIALGLYGLNHRIYEVIPDAQIHYLTRFDLKEGFMLLGNCNVTVIPSMQRGKKFEMVKTQEKNAVFFSKPNPTDWLSDQLKKLVPKLQLPSKIIKKNSLIALHVDSETGIYYGYQKNWPLAHFQTLIQDLNKNGVKPVIIGLKKTEDFLDFDVLDLRGDMSLIAVLTYILENCSFLVAPDSGILSLLYYLDVQAPIKLISFWADPNQGILKQGVHSPNSLLKHVPIIEKDLKLLEPKRILEEILC